MVYSSSSAAFETCSCASVVLRTLYIGDNMSSALYSPRNEERRKCKT